MKDSICNNCSKEFRYAEYRTKGHFCGHTCRGEYQVKQRFKKGTRYKNTMRHYLIKIREYKCSKCNIKNYNNKPITLQVDHIDGDITNNEMNNLRFLCPNCHTQTENWGIANISEKGYDRLKHIK